MKFFGDEHGKFFVFGGVAALTLGIAFQVSAAVPETYTNDNFFVSEHDMPTSFSQDALGNFYGATAAGKVFSQINIENELGIRLQKFSIDEAYFYISDHGIINASDDLAALSIYLYLNDA